MTVGQILTCTFFIIRLYLRLLHYNTGSPLCLYYSMQDPPLEDGQDYLRSSDALNNMPTPTFSLKKRVVAKGEGILLLSSKALLSTLDWLTIIGRMMADQQGEDREQWYEPLVAMQLQALQEGIDWEDQLQASQDAVVEYASYYGVEEFKVVAVEEMISTMIGSYQVTGRADLIIQQRSTGKVWIVDHKTTGRISGTQPKYYGISGQLIGYEYMGREIFGEELWGGMLLNQIQHKSTDEIQES